MTGKSHRNRVHAYGVRGDSIRAGLKAREEMNKMDRFAELLSEHDLSTGDVGGDVIRVSERMGHNGHWGNAMMQKIRRKLGEQAR